MRKQPQLKPKGLKKPPPPPAPPKIEQVKIWQVILTGAEIIKIFREGIKFEKRNLP